MPATWEHLVHQPNTTGSSAVQIIDPSILGQVVNSWNLHESIHGQVLQDIELLVNLHATESVYVSQKFSYLVPGCRGGENPVCMYSLMVVIRRLRPTNEFSDIEIRHLYVESLSSAIQQYRVGQDCHFCWLRQCCHPTRTPKDLTAEESDAIQVVLSTNQARWAQQNIPSDVHIQSITPLPDQLRQFVSNDVENKQVFKTHDNILLNTIQGSMRTTRQSTRSLTFSFKDTNFAILDNLLSPCLKRANVNETAQDIFRRTREGHEETPFSLECQSIRQDLTIEDPPTHGCNKSSVFTINTEYSWLLLAPRLDLLDCVFITSAIEATHFDCEAQPPKPIDPDTKFPSGPAHCSDKARNLVHKGSIVRWSLSQPEGYFSPVRYMSRWVAYSQSVNKAVMDILRYASATAYLRVPTTHTDRMDALHITGNILVAKFKNLYRIHLLTFKKILYTY